MTEQQIERIDQKRQANKAGHDRQVEDIRREPDLNEEAKARYIQEIHARADAKDKEMFEEQTRLIAQDYDRRIT
jgi:hypothetical protein